MNRGTPSRVFLLAASVILLCCGADWAQFRGPQAGGVSDDMGIPVNWSATKNVVWQTALPGFGSSSSITVGDKIFVTCYNGFGLDRGNPGDQKKLRQSLIALDRAKGQILWSRDVEPRLPQAKYSGNIALHGYASSTPASDGAAVYVFFGSSGVVAFSVAGQPLWEADVGSQTHKWGSAASPILFNNRLIVNATIESESIVALDKASGEEVWRTPGINATWVTPAIVGVPDGGTELVVTVQDKVLGFDAATGRPLWECDGVHDFFHACPIVHEDVVFICVGRTPRTLAVRAGGRGDVSTSDILWETAVGSHVPTPLYYDGYLYWIDESGIAVCLSAATGEA